MGIATLERIGMTQIRMFLVGLIILSSGASCNSVSADGQDASDDILVIIGASGAAEYGKQFQQWADAWMQVAKETNANIEVVGIESPADQSDRDRCKSAIDLFGREGAKPLWIVMIGHGTFTRGVAKFNLRGPDVSATEFAEWLNLVSRPLVVINSASSSGPFINRLSGDRRVVIAATKSGTEQNFARFGKHFVAAISDPESDLDHDDEVSVLEAFLSASANVKNFYDAEARIATEHALIDDNGDGKGTPATMFRAARAIGQAKDGSKLDGLFSSRITLAAKNDRLKFTNLELKQRDELENSLSKMRLQRDQLSADDYDRKIEPLLVSLAALYRAAESRAQDSPE
jgi:hypothetical protein